MCKWERDWCSAVWSVLGVKRAVHFRENEKDRIEAFELWICGDE